MQNEVHVGRLYLSKSTFSVLLFSAAVALIVLFAGWFYAESQSAPRNVRLSCLLVYLVSFGYFIYRVVLSRVSASKIEKLRSAGSSTEFRRQLFGPWWAVVLVWLLTMAAALGGLFINF